MTSGTQIEPTTIGALSGWRIRTSHGSALVAKQGAQLLSYTPAGGRPLVWLSEQAHLTPGRSARGGVPVCWPWFGVYARNPPAVRDSVSAPPEAPSHGWVRQVEWQLAEQNVHADAAELVLRHSARPDQHPGWRHHAELALRMQFGAQLGMHLSISNGGQQPFTTALALHTYLAISDVERVEIHGLQGCQYLDMARGWTPRQQAGAIRLQGETDRLYQNTSTPVTLHDPGWQRSVRIAASESHSTVVWNPGAEKAARLGDFAQEGWRRMVCIETARALDDALTVHPGQTATIGLTISARPTTG